MRTSNLSLYDIDAITAAITSYRFEIGIPQPIGVQSGRLRSWQPYARFVCATFAAVYCYMEQNYFIKWQASSTLVDAFASVAANIETK
jgi:hypothetical protein